jgi:CheY-like chemotaxis protein
MNSVIVLVVEDNENDFLLLERAFRKAEIPASLKWVKDGTEARAYLAGEGRYHSRMEHPLPVFIVADLKMPRMDGFELLEWVRSKPLLKRLPFVFLTSSNQAPDINKAYEMGANSYLVKPGNFQDLVLLSSSLRAYWLTLNQRPDLPII